jgi:hypothetical protein
MIPLMLSACNKEKKQPSTTSPAQPEGIAKPAPAPLNNSMAHAPARPAQGMITGKVAETMNSGGYTYALIDTGKEKVWAAGPVTPMAVGDTVSIAAGGQMKNFPSKTLNRTFDKIYFVSAYIKGGAPGGAAAAPDPSHGSPQAAPGGHGAPPSASPPVVKKVKPAKDGYTVAAIYGKRNELAGKEVSVRGQVVKVSNGIMGKNWLHLQDGTGTAPNNDLVVTTDATAKVGDIVLIRGKVAADKDFGHGYKYAVIIENAHVSIE